jgi:hypothetical protein
MKISVDSSNAYLDAFIQFEDAINIAVELDR